MALSPGAPVADPMDPMVLYKLYDLASLVCKPLQQAWDILVANAGGPFLNTPTKKRPRSPDSDAEDPCPDTEEKAGRPIFFSGGQKVDMRSEAQRVADGESPRTHTA